MEALTVRNPVYHLSPRETMAPLCPETMEGYEIVPITLRDSEQVIRFLRRFFFKDEPLNIAVGLLDEPGSTCVELERYCLDSIPEGLSVMAVNQDNQIVGVCLNGVATREETKTQDLKNEEMDECTNPKFKKILNLLSRVSKESDVFEQFSVDRALEIRVVSVDDNCRGQGIAKALLDRSKLLAKELGFPMVRVDCTSHYSAKAVARLGFQCVYTLQYADHLDKDGNPVFRPEPPHACVKTFVTPV